MPRGRVLAARHPRPLLAGRICYGRLDVPLAETPDMGAVAILDAAKLHEPLRDIERVISSPISRALLVARGIAAHTGALLHTDDRLLEMDFGAWEGQPWASLPRSELDAWAADPLAYQPGGRESVNQLLGRVRRAWTGIASAAGTTLLVTHAGPIRCLTHVALAVPLPEAIQASIAYSSVTSLGGG